MQAVHNPLHLCRAKQLTPKAVSLDLDSFFLPFGVEKGKSV